MSDKNQAISTDELLVRVFELVEQVTVARFEGAVYAKLTRAHGYADGYMRALLDAGLVDQKTLLKAIGQARQSVVDREESGARVAAA